MIGPLKLFSDASPNTLLTGANARFLEERYQQYLNDPASVDDSGRHFFASLDQQSAHLGQASPAGRTPAPRLTETAAAKQSSVLRIINAYRVRGHQQADIDPLALLQPTPAPDLDPAFHGLNDSDMNQEFNTGSLAAPERMRLRDILDLVRKVYCGTIGSEYMHITNTEEKRWL